MFTVSSRVIDQCLLRGNGLTWLKFRLRRANIRPIQIRTDRRRYHRLGVTVPGVRHVPARRSDMTRILDNLGSYILFLDSYLQFKKNFKSIIIKQKRKYV